MSAAVAAPAGASLAEAVARAVVQAWPQAVVVTGRAPGPGAPLAALPGVSRLVVAGEATRLTVAAGVVLGGRPAVGVVDRRFVPPSTGRPTLVMTASVVAAAQALGAGWPVLQPARAEDVAGLLASAAPRTVVWVGAAAGAEGMPGRADPDGQRVWRSGASATLVASGAAVGMMADVARMMAGRGLPPTAIEIATIAVPAQRALLGGSALLVGPAAAAQRLRDGRWPGAALRRVDLAHRSPRAVMEAVLAQVSVA